MTRQYIQAIFILAMLFCGSCATRLPSKSPGDGFIKIFDGKTLKGWEGDPVYWKVENGNLVGTVTPETILKRNSFITWRGGTTKDFELKVEFRVSARGNSGINYRSEEVPGVPYALKGYQCDIDGPNKYTGQNYEERGRTFLALPGDRVELWENKKSIVTPITAKPDSLKSHIRKDDWNQVHLIVKGNRMQHFINGVLFSEVTDNDLQNRKADGLLGVQVHVGPPMKIEYRKFYLKPL